TQKRIRRILREHFLQRLDRGCPFGDGPGAVATGRKRDRVVGSNQRSILAELAVLRVLFRDRPQVSQRGRVALYRSGGVSKFQLSVAYVAVASPDSASIVGVDRVRLQERLSNLQ